MPLEGALAALGDQGTAAPKWQGVQSYGTPENILNGLSRTESSGNPYALNPQSKALGEYQFTPETLIDLHKQGVKFDPLDPAQSRAAADYLFQQKLAASGGDVNKALAAYGGFKTKDPSAYQAKVLMAPQSPVDNGSIPLSGAMQVLSGEEATQPSAVQENAPKAAPAAPVSDLALGTTTENALAGAGKGVTDIGRGFKQLIDIPAMWLETKFPGLSQWSQQKLGMPSAAESAAATNYEVEQAKATDQPLMNTGPGMGGYVAGNIAATMLPLGAASKASTAAEALLNPVTYKSAIAAGALQGALQPVAGNDSRLLNTAAGGAAGALGNLAVNTVARIAQPVSEIASAAHQKAVDVLEKYGVPLDAAQKSGSAVLNRIRSAFSDNPWTLGTQRELAGTQQAAFNKAALKTIGEDATAATSDVMGAAQKRINGVFKDILDRNNIDVTDTVLSRIGAVQSAAAESEKMPVVKIANRIIDSVGDDGTIKGQVAYGIKKDLDRLSSSADTDLAFHARQLRSTVMDAINGSLDGADRQAFAQARGQFANMMKLEPAIDKYGGGNISPARLANVLGQKANRSASIYGKGPQELVDLAQAGNLLLGDKLGQSGTTPRLIMQSILPVVGAATGANYGGVEGSGLGAAGGLALGALGPKAAQAAMINPVVSNYIAKGITGAATPLRDLMLLPQTQSAIGGTLRRIPAVMASQKP